MHVFDCMKIFTINILIIEERNTKQFKEVVIVIQF